MQITNRKYSHKELLKKNPLKKNQFHILKEEREKNIHIYLSE